MGCREGRLNALIEANAQGERAESTSGRSGSLAPFRPGSEAELSAARSRSPSGTARPTRPGIPSHSIASRPDDWLR